MTLNSACSSIVVGSKSSCRLHFNVVLKICRKHMQLPEYFLSILLRSTGLQKLAVFPCPTMKYAGSLQLAVYFPCTTKKYAGSLQLAVYFPCTTTKYAGSLQLAVYFPCTTKKDAGSLQLAVYFPCTTKKYAGSLQLAVYFCVLLKQLCCGLIGTQQIHCRSPADQLKLFFSVRVVFN